MELGGVAVCRAREQTESASSAHLDAIWTAGTRKGEVCEGARVSRDKHLCRQTKEMNGRFKDLIAHLKRGARYENKSKSDD